MSKLKPITFKFSEDLIERLKKSAKAESISTSEFLRNAAEASLDNRDQKMNLLKTIAAFTARETKAANEKITEYVKNIDTRVSVLDDSLNQVNKSMNTVAELLTVIINSMQQTEAGSTTPVKPNTFKDLTNREVLGSKSEQKTVQEIPKITLQNSDFMKHLEKFHAENFPNNKLVDRRNKP